MQWVAVVFNILLVLVFAPLLDGFERWLKAKLQRRKGPPIIQTWLDIIKLFKRSYFIPEGSHKALFMLGPHLAFASVLCTFLIVPTFFRAHLGFAGDIIAVFYLISLAVVSICFGAFASGNAFAQEGANREISLLMAEELALGLALATLAVLSGTTAISKTFPLPLKLSSAVLFAVFCALSYFSSARLPFDIPEAEPEIIEGPFIEYGGKLLGFAKYYMLLKRFLLTSIVINFILPVDIGPATRLVAFLALAFVASTSFATVEITFGRFRTEHAISFLKTLALISAVGWALSIFNL